MTKPPPKSCEKCPQAAQNPLKGRALVEWQGRSAARCEAPLAVVPALSEGGSVADSHMAESQLAELQNMRVVLEEARARAHNLTWCVGLGDRGREMDRPQPPPPSVYAGSRM
jgi:hypothetical protein